MSRGNIDHCVGKIVELAGREAPTPRVLLQLGYNLGRLAELTGAGREPFWDRWKDPVEHWDTTALRELARRLQGELASRSTDANSSPLP